MTVIYAAVKYLTFPGTILHAFFEHMCCRWFKVLVDDARPLQFNEMAGHTEHELVKRKGASFDICFIPFLFSFLIGVITSIYGAITVYYFKRFSDVFAWICLYIGISCLTNLFPQIEDVMMVKENFYQKQTGKKKGTVSKILIAPFYAILYVGAKLEKVGLTLVTSIAFSFAMPSIFGLFVPAIYDLFK